MCDMRDLNVVGYINLTTYNNDSFRFIPGLIYKGFDDPLIKETGIYRTIASGSGYYWFDGEKFSYYD